MGRQSSDEILAGGEPWSDSGASRSVQEEGLRERLLSTVGVSLASRACYVEHRVWMLGHDPQEDASAALGLPPSLFPVAQGADLDSKEGGEIALAQSRAAAESLDPRGG